MIFVTNRLPYDRTREVGRVTESLPRNDAYALILFLLFFGHATLVRRPPHLPHLLLWPCTQGSRAYTRQLVDTFPDHTFYVLRPHLLRIKATPSTYICIDNRIEDRQSNRKSTIESKIDNRQSNRKSTIESKIDNRKSTIESKIENRQSNRKSTIESKIDNRQTKSNFVIFGAP